MFKVGQVVYDMAANKCVSVVSLGNNKDMYILDSYKVNVGHHEEEGPVHFILRYRYTSHKAGLRHCTKTEFNSLSRIVSGKNTNILIKNTDLSKFKLKRNKNATKTNR